MVNDLPVHSTLRRAPKLSRALYGHADAEKELAVWNGSDDFNQSDGRYLSDIACDVRIFCFIAEKWRKINFNETTLRHFRQKDVERHKKEVNESVSRIKLEKTRNQSARAIIREKHRKSLLIGLDWMMELLVSPFNLRSTNNAVYMLLINKFGFLTTRRSDWRYCRLKKTKVSCYYGFNWDETAVSSLCWPVKWPPVHAWTQTTLKTETC